MPLSGRLLNSLNATPLGGATVQIDELRRQTTSGADGTFAFDNVPPGTYHCRCSRRASRRGARKSWSPLAALRSSSRSTPDLHFEEVVSVSGDARSQFDTFQPTSVLAGQELSKQLERSLGATLRISPAWPREASGRRRRVRSFAGSTAIAC